MNEEKIIAKVEEAMNPETFDVLDYAENQEAGTDEVTVYVNIKGAKELQKLLRKRAEFLAERRALEAKGKAEPLGLDEAFEDTEFDNQINALVEELESTALIFELRTVAPALVRAIERSYEAKADKEATEEEKAAHNTDRTADILSRAIASVRRGDGSVDPTAWDRERLKAFEEKVYDEQFLKLMQALYEMVYTGAAFEESLTADFS